MIECVQTGGTRQTIVESNSSLSDFKRYKCDDPGWSCENLIIDVSQCKKSELEYECITPDDYDGKAVEKKIIKINRLKGTAIHNLSRTHKDAVKPGLDTIFVYVRLYESCKPSEIKRKY